MTLGWVAAICTVWVRGGRAVLRPLSFIGRATLSFYVFQSVVFVPLFYHFGAGLAEVWSPAYRLGGAVVGCLLQLWLAAVWFKHFAGHDTGATQVYTRSSLASVDRLTGRRAPQRPSRW